MEQECIAKFEYGSYYVQTAKNCRVLLEALDMISTNSLIDTLKKTRDMINRLNIYGARKTGKRRMIDELSEIIWQIDVELAKLESLRQYQDEGCQCDQCAGTRNMSETDKQILKGRNSL